MYDPKLEKQETIVTKDELLYLYYLPIYELITENQIDESTSCEFEVNWDKRGIKFRVKMDKELFDFFKETQIGLLDLMKCKMEDYAKLLTK